VIRITRFNEAGWPKRRAKPRTYAALTIFRHPASPGSLILSMTHNLRLCLVLFAVGASCFGACSDSGFSSAPTSGGSAGGPAGQAGEEPMSSSGSGTGATANTGGSDIGAGQPAGGGEPMSGGEAGMSSMEPTVGTTCLACPVANGGATDEKGCAALKACDASPTCKPWADCVRACDDDNCATACDAANPEVARYRNAVYACLCQTCADSCAPLGVCDRKCDSSKDLEVAAVAPDNLAQTLLYAMDSEVAPYARSYQPKYPLWSDGALKDRFIYVPACSRIDTTDMDHWSFPVGTRLWKHFRIPSSNGQDIAPKLVETRFIHRFGPGADDWVFAAYQWPVDLGGAGTLPNPTLAKFVPNGVVNANGTTHDIPNTAQCKNCHTKLSERVLSFGAFQLSHQLAGVTITTVSNDGWLTVPAPQGFQPPGTEIAQAALGYMHANCGNCHNASFRPVEPPPLMKLLVTQTVLDQTDTVTSLFNVPTQNVDFVGLDRIEPGSSDKSEIVVRMQRRPPQTGQMPPLATKVVHPEGIAAITAWINDLDPSGF
jgi:hypothetical protein